ncbi:ribonuclease III [Acidobacteria bacterium AH-259-D05]|nr:ribonuclease III [Acidobacteria bacterium AH-259-D05]
MRAEKKHLQELEARLGYSFTNTELLERALTHTSFTYEQRSSLSGDTSKDYESLEFLGDTILNFLISEYLFQANPSRTEGELSKIRSFLVSANHLASLSRELDLGAFLRLGHGEEKTGGRQKKALLADLFESLTAAIYLDGGLEPTRRFIFAQFSSRLEEIAEEQLDVRDRKSLLQERLQARGFSEPTYRVIDELGPDHKKEFVIEVYVKDKCLARASGRSKKEAQQRAAEQALEKLDDLFISKPSDWS